MTNDDPRRKFATLRQRYAKIQTLPNTTTASTGVCSAAEWPEPLHECLQLQGNQIRSKTELPDLCRCGRACARSAAHEILGERQRRWWGLFWWRGSINIALLPSRLLVCLSRTSTMLHHTPHTTHHTPQVQCSTPRLKKKTARAVNGCVRQRPRCFILPHTGCHRMRNHCSIAIRKHIRWLYPTTSILYFSL